LINNLLGLCFITLWAKYLNGFYDFLGNCVGCFEGWWDYQIFNIFIINEISICKTPQAIANFHQKSFKI
jgi:hypothetical protein